MFEKDVLTSTSCNFCKRPILHRFIDLIGESPNLKSTVEKSQHFIPTFLCEQCFLVQTAKEYPEDTSQMEYITSYSPSWLNIMHDYGKDIFEKMGESPAGFSVALTNHRASNRSNDQLSFHTLNKKDVYSFIEMYGKADRIIGHNELAYVNDINDFISAIKLLLTPEGIFTLEFPHLLEMMECMKFDFLKECRFPYFSFTTIDIILKHHKLVIYDVENGFSKGYLRIYGKHQENLSRHISRNTPALRGRERDKGMSSLAYYLNFKSKMERQMESYEIQ